MDIFSSYCYFLVLLGYAQGTGDVASAQVETRFLKKTDEICQHVVHNGEDTGLNPKGLVLRN